MIAKKDIRLRSVEWQLDLDVVEKDYVLGWLLTALAEPPETSRRWVFKGGTCLKKCFFEGSTAFTTLRSHAAEHSEEMHLATTAPEDIDGLAPLADRGAAPVVRTDVVASTPVALPRWKDPIVVRFSRVSRALLARVA